MAQTTPTSRNSWTVTPTSASPTAPSPLAPLLKRHAVRSTTGPAMMAVPVVRPQQVSLPDGTFITTQVGEWLITRNEQVVDVVSAHELKKRYEPTEKEGVLVNGECRSRIERILGVGSTETPEMLATAVERLARLKIGTLQVDFTPGQWEYLKHRADKMGLTVGDMVKRIGDRFTQDIWTL